VKLPADTAVVVLGGLRYSLATLKAREFKSKGAEELLPFFPTAVE